MKDIFALRLYTRVRRAWAGFSAYAARECGVASHNPRHSRIVADLEADLRYSAAFTQQHSRGRADGGGRRFSGAGQSLSSGALDEAQAQLFAEAEISRGLVRMSAPTSFGIRTVIPRLAAFTAKHPDLHIHLLLEDMRRDLVRDAVDVAIRLGRLIDSSATAKLVARIPRVIVAAPIYLEQAGVPATPTDLAKHRIVGGSAAAVPTAWAFERGGEKVTVDLQPHFSTNENEGAVAAAAAGFGITSTSEWACQRALADGSLVRLLTGWKTADIPVHAYFPMGSATRAAARALVDYLAAQLDGNAIHVRHT